MNKHQLKSTTAGWVIRPRSGAATLKATGAPSEDGPFTRHRILVPTILDLLNSEQPPWPPTPRSQALATEMLFCQSIWRRNSIVRAAARSSTSRELLEREFDVS
jgi:hypothetical protein